MSKGVHNTAQPVPQVQHAGTASARPSLQILCPVPATRHGCSAASVGCMGVEEEKDREIPTWRAPDILSLFPRKKSRLHFLHLLNLLLGKQALYIEAFTQWGTIVI